MEIRRATENDLEQMVILDRESYGEYGAKKDYFIKKLENENIIVAYDKGKMIGFIVFDILEKDDIPDDFCDLTVSTPIKARWAHIVAFTTRDNYKNKEVDSRILLAAEEITKNNGCVESYVPLSKDHPYKENGVFEFWKNNGYKKVGEIKWKAGPNEFVECFFYRKSL